MKKHKYDPSMGRVVTSLLFAIGVLMLSLFAWVVEGQIAQPDTCAMMRSHFDIVEDYTDIYLEAYSVPYRSERWHEIRETLYAPVIRDNVFGLYDINDYWVIAYRIRGGNIRIQAGASWQTGDDGQLHTPGCYAEIPGDYGGYFESLDNHIRCYPRKCG